MLAVNKPQIYKNTQKYVLNAIRSGWISSSGSYLDLFAEKFSKFIGVKHTSLINSGTAALHLALHALDIGEGDEVILPALTIGSCYFSIWYTGAKAIPVDVDEQTLTIDPLLIEGAITQKTKAIMVVHLYGHPCDMNAIQKIAKKYKLKVIEDAAEAHGAEYKGKKVGSIGDVACFSFYANKIVTTGEGGAITTNNTQLFKKIENLKKLNFDPQKRFSHLGIGYKYVMTNLQAAIGVASLEKIQESIQKKKKMNNLYKKELKTLPFLLPQEASWAKSVTWMYYVVIDPSKTNITKERVTKILEKKYHIETRDFFFPPNEAFEKMGMYKNKKFPISEKFSQNGFYIPSGLGNTYEEFKKVSSALKEIFKK